MANADRPQGAIPYGDVLRVSRYVAGGTVYPGDFVKMDNSGRIVAGSAAGALIGVAATYATSGNDIAVYDNPDQRFIVQSDDATEPAAQTAVGLNYDIVATAGNSSYKASRMELDGSSGATTPSTLPLRLMEVIVAADNAFGANARCIVVINNHQLGKNTVGL